MELDNPQGDCVVENNAEDNMFSQMAAKSSVKLKHTTRGTTWDIKVVTGEEAQIAGLIKTAIQGHKEIIAEIAKLGKED